jgi:1,4-alpha-glucan branching enzyme
MPKKADIKRKLTFSLDAPGAKEVILMGDFNKWDRKRHPMGKNAKGLWSKAVMLSIGRYEYKFLVDGEWWHDPKNDQVCYNQHGTLNSVITVS